MNDGDLYDPETSLALSASAGSGKTFALTTRLLALLLKGAHPWEIVAITFTNPAAREIGEKTFARLSALAGGSREELARFGDILDETPGRIREMAVGVRSSLLRYFSLLHVSTIHSFFMRILKQFPRVAGAIDVRVLDDAEKKRLLEEARERYFTAMARSPEMLERVHDFMTRVRERGVSAAAVIDRHHRSIGDIYHALDPLVDVFDIPLEEAHGLFRRRQDHLFGHAYRRAIGTLMDITEPHIGGENKIHNVDTFHRRLEAFLRGGRVTSLVEQGALKGYAAKGYVNYLEKLRGRLSETARSRFDESFTLVWRGLRDYLMAEMEYVIALRLDVFHAVDGLYRDEKSALNGIDYADIELFVVSFLQSLPEGGVFGRILDLDVRHLLIDEFQDTSELQWRALHRLTAQIMEKGGTLYYVGDEKQSIYRWRGGEPWLFERVRRQMGLREGRLPFSYRQNRRLVDFVNGIFGDLSETTGCFPYTPQDLPEERVDSEGDLDGNLAGELDGNLARGFVLVHGCVEKEEALGELVSWIRRFREAGVRNRDMAILCRKNDQVEEIENLLRDHRIPHTSVGRSRLMKDPCVLDLVGMMRFVLDPDEELNLVSVLRTPLFRTEYGEILRWRGEGGHLRLSDVMRKERTVGESLQALLRCSRYTSPPSFLHRLMGEMDLFERYPGKRGILNAFLELAYDFESSRDHNTLADFVDYLDDNASDLTLRADGEGVSVQTIHSSKGLEYHTVMVPYLDAAQNFSFRNGPILFRRDPEGRIAGVALGVQKYFDFFPDREGMEETLRQNRESYLIDEINTLYVALTRARENLVVLPLVTEEGKPTKTIGGLLCRSLFSRFGADSLPWRSGKPVPSRETEGGRPATYAYMKRYRDGEPHPERAAADEEENGTAYDGERRIALLAGLIFHRVMEGIPAAPVTGMTGGGTAEEPRGERIADDGEIDALVSSAAFVEGKGYSRRERGEASSRARGTVRRVLRDESLFPFLSAGSAGEVNLVSSSFGNLIGRIDRLVIGEDRIDVLDFKTGAVGRGGDLDRAVARYRPQIVGYCEALRGEFGDRRIRGMLYFTEAEENRRLVTVYDEAGHR